MQLDAYFQPDTALPLGHIAADDAVIRATLAEVLDSVSPPLSHPPAPVDIVRVINTAARQLMAGHLTLPEALRLTSAAPPRLRDRLGISMPRCNSLFRLQDWNQLAAEMDRLFHLGPNPPHRDQRLQFLASRLGLGWRMPGWTRAAPLLSKPVDQPPAEWICTPFQPGEGGGEIEQNYAALLSERTGRVFGTKDQADLQLAATQADRDMILWRADGQVRTLLAQQGTVPSEGQAVTDFFEKAVRDLVQADVTPLQADLAAGRNVILLRAHAGVRMIEMPLADLPCPVVQIVAHNFIKPGLNLVVTAHPQHMIMDFLRLGKAIRRSPHVVMVFAVGRAGTEFRHMPFRGGTARIAMGGAALARLADSVLYFMRSVWTGTGYRMELTRGPEITPQMPRSEVDDLFATFYLQGLDRILDGAVVDYGSIRFASCMGGDSAEDAE